MKIIKILVLVLVTVNLCVSNENESDYIDLDTFETDYYDFDSTQTQDIYDSTYGIAIGTTNTPITFNEEFADKELLSQNQEFNNGEANNIELTDDSQDNLLYNSTINDEDTNIEESYELETDSAINNEEFGTNDFLQTTQSDYNYYNESTVQYAETIDSEEQTESYELEMTEGSEEFKTTDTSITQETISETSNTETDEFKEDPSNESSYVSSSIEQNISTIAPETDEPKDSTTSTQSTSTINTNAYCSLKCTYGFKFDAEGRVLCSCNDPCENYKCFDRKCVVEFNYLNHEYYAVCKPYDKLTNRPSKCYKPSESGSCKNYSSRFFWNKDKNRCQHFIYTGCDGNDNSFETYFECQSTCYTCSFKVAKGPCTSSLTRYYYDSDRRECLSFSYGGCEGNSNNFESKEKCESICIQNKPYTRTKYSI